MFSDECGFAGVAVLKVSIVTSFKCLLVFEVEQDLCESEEGQTDDEGGDKETDDAEQD